MKTTLGKAGLTKTYQDPFPETTPCCHCPGEARIGFVAHEGIDEDDRYDRDAPHLQYLAHMYDNKFHDGEAWLHDCCAVAVYFCKKCLNPTALYNQG